MKKLHLLNGLEEMSGFQTKLLSCLLNKMAKGGFLDITTMVSAGVGAYAAKKSGSMSALLLTLAKYALVVIGIVLAVYVVASLLKVASVERFVPVAPSAEGDKKVVTPAGNVIVY